MSNHRADDQTSIRDGHPSDRAGKVAIVATLDTKGRETSYLARVIEHCGRKTLTIDVGTSNGRARSKPGGSDARVAAPAELLRAIAQSAREEVNELLRTSAIDAIVGVAGGKGSAVFGELVSDLPYGFPKLLVSSARPALLAELALHNDIILYPTLVDLFGINAFTERALENAGRAVAAMHYVPAQGRRERKTVAITAFGVTTPAANRCVARLGEAGVDAIVFPANGAGGRKMEQLVSAGEFDAVLDLTTTELADELVGGTASAGPDRLKAASLRMIPQLVAPGAVDMVNFGPPSSVPAEFKGRQFYFHTPFTTLMRTNAEENERIGRLTAERLAQAKAPTVVLWPAKGVSDYDQEGGIFRNPEADKAWFDAVRQNLPPSIVARELNCHINDPEFAEAASSWIVERLTAGGACRADV
ncbi:uncharacterized protein (UPF0261 family) [Bradyrhizobium sp. USDA 4472]